MEHSPANTYEKNRICQGERSDSHSVRKHPITAAEYESRSAEYEYEYEKQPSASRTSRPSYSVRNADGTRTRTRNRCSELASMMSGAMSGATVMIPTGLESLREPKQPTAAIEYEYRSAEYEYEYEQQPSASRTSRPTYSVRNADGTRTRTRNRCSEPSSMMSIAKVMIPTGLESLREPKQPTAAIEYESRSAEYEYEYEKYLAPGFSSPPYDNFLVFDKA